LSLWFLAEDSPRRPPGGIAAIAEVADTVER